MTRRDFLKASGSAAFAVSGLAGWREHGRRAHGDDDAVGAHAHHGRRVIVVGGGWAGATAPSTCGWRTRRSRSSSFEPNRKFISCPFSNLVLSGVRSIGSLTFGYNGLREQHGVKILHESARPSSPTRGACA